MEKLLIAPFVRPASGCAYIPGSKSITNRAILLAYLSDQTTDLSNILLSEDTAAMQQALRQLGLSTHSDAETHLSIEGCSGQPPIPEATLDVRNAGTVARFLTAALCLKTGATYSLDGTPAMRKRPMKGLMDALETTGAARVEYLEEIGHFPFCLKTEEWRAKELEVDASTSSQLLSALLMAATQAPHPMQIRLKGETVSLPFVDMTVRMIQAFGGKIEAQAAGIFWVTPGLAGPRGGRYAVEPDATAASYFWALPLAVGGEVLVQGFPQDSLQGDLEFINVLPLVGIEVDSTTKGIRARPSTHPQASTPVTFNFNAFSDTFLTLAALAPLLPVPVRIEGIAHTRHQETDRIHAMATELKKMGQTVEEGEDYLTIKGSKAALMEGSKEQPFEIETYEDHRVAMSFSILGSHNLHGDGRPWMQILDPNCTGKTFPGFFDELARIRSIAKSNASL